MSVANMPTGGEWADEPTFELHEVVNEPNGTGYETNYPIPLEHRLYYIEEEPLPDYYPLPEDIAEAIGATVEWVELTAEELGIEELEFGGYPQYALPVLKQEFEWQQAYLAEGETLSRKRMGELLGMPHRSWVTNNLKKFSYEPFCVVPVGNLAVESQYVKSVIQHLRAVKMSVRPAGDWVTTYDLTEISGGKRDTVFKILEEKGFESQMRRSRRSGKECPHHSPEAVNAVQERALIKRDERWYTKREIRRAAARGDVWVDRELARFEDMMKMLPDSQNRLRGHYPDLVFEIVVGISKGMDQSVPPLTSEFVTIGDCATQSHRDVDTVLAILDYLKEPVVDRLNASRRRVPSCKADLIDAVRDFDITLFQDKNTLAKRVSDNRRLLLALHNRIEAVKGEIEQPSSGEISNDPGRLAALRSELGGLGIRRHEADRKLRRSEVRYHNFLEAEHKFNQSKRTPQISEED